MSESVFETVRPSNTLSDAEAAKLRDDPFGIERAENYQHSEELQACATNPECPAHLDATAFAQLLLSLRELDETIGSFDNADGANSELDLWLAKHILSSEERASLTIEQSRALDNCLVDFECREDDRRSLPVFAMEYVEAAETYRQTLRLLLEERQVRVAGIRENGLLKLEEMGRQGSPTAYRLVGQFIMELQIYSNIKKDVFGGIDREAADRRAVGALLDALALGDAVSGRYLAQLIEQGRAAPSHNVDDLLMRSYKGGDDAAGYILHVRSRMSGYAPVGMPDIADLDPDTRHEALAWFRDPHRHFEFKKEREAAAYLFEGDEEARFRVTSTEEYGLEVVRDNGSDP